MLPKENKIRHSAFVKHIPICLVPAYEQSSENTADTGNTHPGILGVFFPGMKSSLKVGSEGGHISQIGTLFYV